MRWLRLLIGLLVFGAAVAAGAAEPSPALRQRAGELVALLNGTVEPDKLFSPAFLAHVPPPQVKTIAQQLRSEHGAARGVAAIEARSATSATVRVEMERAVLRLEMSVGPAPPYLVEELLVTGADVPNDSVRSVFGEIAGLPGDVSIEAARLGEGDPRAFLTLKADRPLAIGSAFKLFILAELVRQVKAGQRHWADVAPLDRQSLPSGFLQQWPKGSPVTLHTLAALMISQSDNSAADTLLALLGREKVERSLPEVGVSNPAGLRPFLATREAFLLKGDPALRARWSASGETEKRRLLAGELARGSLQALDLALFAGAPLAIREVEWFASTADLVRVLDWLRRSGDRTALDILAINPGLPDLRRDYAYVGFKGGSERGVLNLSFLIRRRDGTWFAVSIGWNDAAAPVDEARLVSAAGRLLALLAKDEDAPR